MIKSRRFFAPYKGESIIRCSQLTSNLFHSSDRVVINEWLSSDYLFRKNTDSYGICYGFRSDLGSGDRNGIKQDTESIYIDSHTDF